MALPDTEARPWMAEQLQLIYDGSANAPDNEIDLSAYTTATTTIQNATIEAFRALFVEGDFASPTEFATFNTRVDTLKTDIAGDLSDTVFMATDALTQVQNQYIAFVQAEGYTNTCPECLGAGIVEQNKLDGSGSTELTGSPLCNEYGYLVTAKQIAYPVNYEDV